jgi:hypothetical protein
MIAYHVSLGKECSEDDAEQMIAAFLDGPEAKEETKEQLNSVLEEEDEDIGPHITFEKFAGLYSERAGSCARQAIKASVEMIQAKGDAGELLLEHIKTIDKEEKQQQMDTIRTMLSNIATDEEQLDIYANSMTEALIKRTPFQGGMGHMQSSTKGSKLHMNLNSESGGGGSSSTNRTKRGLSTASGKKRSTRGSQPFLSTRGRGGSRGVPRAPPARGAPRPLTPKYSAGKVMEF